MRHCAQAIGAEHDGIAALLFSAFALQFAFALRSGAPVNLANRSSTLLEIFVCGSATQVPLGCLGLANRRHFRWSSFCTSTLIGCLRRGRIPNRLRLSIRALQRNITRRFRRRSGLAGSCRALPRELIAQSSGSFFRRALMSLHEQNDK
jgi:hypothetical protein